jgi:ferrochelatase
VADYDAILVVSFGGPEGMPDVMPFLENVLRGRNVPRERMLAVAKHYELFGGMSPINAQNRQLIAALKQELTSHGLTLPIYWGNRNWHPLLSDTVQQMATDRRRRAIAFVTSAYSSYSSCRQYLEDIERARAAAEVAVGNHAPGIDKLRAFYNHPGFITANAENVRAALARIPEERRAATEIVFTAHSLPVSMAGQCEYEAQLQEASSLVASQLGHRSWRLVFQSRSGPPSQPWLEPDVCEYLRELKTAGTMDVVISPVGFVSDHMEIVFDLDTEARALCEELGMNMVRASTAGTHPAFIQMVRELISERIDPAAPRKFLGSHGLPANECQPGCCSFERRDPKEPGS